MVKGFCPLPIDKYSTMNIKELNSFKMSDAVKFHDTLNQRIFNNEKLKPEVRKQLLLIAKDFITELGISDLHVKDVTVSGSNAAYSYTKHSDLDLHVLVDMSKLSDDEVYQELFSAKKFLYNENYDIKVHGIPVELYVQDSNEPVVSLGEYSVKNDKWIKLPIKRKANLDQSATRLKYEKLKAVVLNALKATKSSEVEKITNKIRRYRQAGLDKGGEFSPENLAFKMLRSQGYITKLYDLRNKLHGQELTIETMYMTESSKPKKYAPVFNFEDLTEDEKNLNNINGKIPFDIWMSLVERVLAKRANVLLESDAEDTIDLIKNIELSSEKNLMIGKKYFYIPIIMIGNNLYVMDQSGNFPPKDKPKLSMLIEQHKDGLTFKFRGSEKTFPYQISTRLAYSTVIVLNNAEDYDKVRTLLKLNFNILLPSANSEVGEDATMQFAAEKTPVISPYSGIKDNQYRGAISEMPDTSGPVGVQPGGWRKYKVKTSESASGYIPSNAEKNDPRFKTALTVDIKPDTMKKNAKAFGNKISRAGIPPTLKSNGKF